MDYTALPDRILVTAYRIAKRRLRPFFANPRAMQRLRVELERRGLLEGRTEIRKGRSRGRGKGRKNGG